MTKSHEIGASMLLNVQGVTKRFGGVIALDSVSFSLRSGEVLGILGGNGSGKSTLLNVISRTIAPDAGTTELEGKSLHPLKTDQVAKRGVARVWQVLSLVDEMTAWDHVTLGLWSRGRRSSLTRADVCIVGDALADLSVWPVRHSSLKTLSYFQKREADFARCLVSDPKLLLCDELTSGLTSDERELFVGHVQKLKTRGVGVILVEHHPEFIRQVADTVIVLEAGSVSYFGPVAHLGEEMRCYP
jgi:ABC-type branched-subunit amino acid transport system ATPase component